VGGTGRSGTTVIARLLAQHSRYAMIPREVRFHADGLPDLLSGDRSKRWFVNRLQHYWYFRVVGDGTERGIWNVVPPPEFEQATRSFSARFQADPDEAARRLMRDLFDTFARRLNKPAWVEMTPTNVEAAPTLHTLFPSMRLIHTVRDGRDVACSAPRFAWGPDTVGESLEWWARLLRRAHEGTSRVPEESVLVIQFEDLVRNRREETYARLLQFLELPDERRMRRWFDANLTEARAHIGRWRSDLEPAARDELQAMYERIVGELRAEGIQVPAPTS
jgi:hypothetical protein